MVLLLGFAVTGLRSSPFQQEAWNSIHDNKEDCEYNSGYIALLTILSLLILFLSPFSIHGWFYDNFHVHPQYL